MKGGKSVFLSMEQFLLGGAKGSVPKKTTKFPSSAAQNCLSSLAHYFIPVNDTSLLHT